MKNCQLMLVLSVLTWTTVAQAKSLSELVELAYKNNPGISALVSQVDAEGALITSHATLDSPVIGLFTLDRGQMTQYLLLSQKIRFPVKYFLQASAQKNSSQSAEENLRAKQLSIRKEVASVYYEIYSAQKIIRLTEANMQAVKEFARIAEKKYAAGTSPQGDSMKAHFELTQLELELIRQKQEEEALQEKLRAVVGKEIGTIDLYSQDLDVPKISKVPPENSETLGSSLMQSSPVIKAEQYALNRLEDLKSLSRWEFAPDIQLQYQHRTSGTPVDSRIYSVGLTMPLWFWKQSSEASAASARALAQENKLDDLRLRLVAHVQDLAGKVKAGRETLEIYETSLIPQAQGAYNSTRASYQANRTSFLDLLDSERSLYRVKTGFFKSLSLFAKNLSDLESNLGYTVSNLTQENSEVSQ